MRPRYTASGLLSARDLNDEQADLLQRLRRHDRFLHGYGVVCGLSVYAAPSRPHPWTVGVCPGYAVGPCGDEIEVPSRVLVDVRDFAWSRPYVNGVGLRLAFVALHYVDDAGSPVDSSGGCSCGCGCNSAPESDSTAHIRDGYVVEILWAREERSTLAIDLCQPGAVPCPENPAGRDVILAAVRLPAFESTPLTDEDIVQL